MEYTDVIITGLTIITGVLAISTFFNGKTKTHHEDGERGGELKSDLKYIKDLLLEVRAETKEINATLACHSADLAAAKEAIASAHKRIDECVERIERLENTEKDR